jgi:hypothetical protein
MFFRNNIIGDIYLDLLAQFVFTQVDDTEKENASGVVFHKTLHHFSLNARFPNHIVFVCIVFIQHSQHP